MRHCEVLIAGAGPTGLVLALWLRRQGVDVRIIDLTAEPGTTSRAVAVQARTLELYRQLDLTAAVLAQGIFVPAINLWIRGRRKIRVAFDAMADGISPYGPFIFPQDQHETLLIQRLAALGVSVERETELMRFEETADGIAATLRGSDGLEVECACAYLAGCDGARSVVRRSIDAEFPGGTYEQLFYVADIAANGPAMDGELHVDLEQADFLAVFPMKGQGEGQGRARLIGTVRGERAANAQSLQFDDVSAQAIADMRVDVGAVNWFSTYHVHHRVADRFRRGRAFLLGDAAHIHSPAGGQGMNTGIGDAINLAWKLKNVLRKNAPDALLDSYEAERRPFAQKLVATTDRAFTFATASGRLASFVRTRIAPLAMPALFSFAALRRYLFRAVSQAAISYRKSPISQGRAGSVHGGDRLPWAKTPDRDNFDAMTAPEWQVHVYGAATEPLKAWCDGRVSLHVFDWREADRKAGLARDAMYLIRPDGYVALASPRQRPEEIEDYLAKHGFALAGPAS